MRLLHTTEPRFESFVHNGSAYPKYAIISHRWGKDEITHDEMEYLLLDESDRARVLTPRLLRVDTKTQSQGYSKVIKAREIAAAAGYRWIWIDTCCINTESSSELSEAINSMFKWYQ
jgi:hypothetical protein